MINFFTEIILIVLMGIAMGIFGTLLFFRLDKSWKQLLLGIGSLFSAGGLGRAFIYYLEIPKNSAALFFLILMIGIIISVYFSFSKLCKLLKNQSGKNVIRILDIVLGYNNFLKDYYETRKKDIDKSINLEELKKKEAELNNKERYLTEFQDKLQEQKKGALILELPEHGEVPITNSFIRKIPLYVDHICQFKNNLDKFTLDFLQKFTNDKSHNRECLKGYFIGIGIYIANDLFGTSNADVRTHFRVLKGDKYVQYTVTIGNEVSTDKISDIPKGRSMIEKSFELKKSLVASLNPDSNYDTKTRWEDFMTITYYNLIEDGSPFLSMGISIKYSEQFGEMLYFINFYKIENCLHAYINKINEVCNIIETLK